MYSSERNRLDRPSDTLTSTGMPKSPKHSSTEGKIRTFTLDPSFMDGEKIPSARPFHVAAYYTDIGLIKALCQIGARINVLDSFGRTSLDYILRQIGYKMI